jgi:hypothetical protein
MHQLLTELLPPSVEANEAGVEADLASDLADSAAPSPPRHDGPVVGLLTGFDQHGIPQVRFAGSCGERPIPARSVVPLGSDLVGREVVLLFEQGDPARPLVMGVVRAPRLEPVRTEIDGEKLVLTAEREIVLRCGAASITLTRAGKVLIRGTYVLSRSSGVNRIKGGSVQIN